MTDTVFRTKQEQTEEVLPEGKITSVGGEAPVEVPYLDYEREHGYPHSVDYFKLGDSWRDPVGGFPEEIAVIEEYFQKKIEDGEIANSISTIKEKLKSFEKMNNLKGEERPLVKIETLAAYIKFLCEADKIKFNVRRYGRAY
jgi:hypothetical protein